MIVLLKQAKSPEDNKDIKDNAPQLKDGEELVEEVVLGEDKGKGKDKIKIRIKRIIKKGNNVIEQLIEKDPKEGEIIKEEYIKEGQGEGDPLHKLRAFTRKIIKGNKVIQQLVEKEKIGDEEKEEIKSQKEEIIKNKKGKKDDNEEIIEEEEILQKEDGNEGKIKLRIKKRIIKGNKVTEQTVEKEVNADGTDRENAKEIIISQDKLPLENKGDYEVIQEIVLDSEEGESIPKGKGKKIRIKKIIRKGNDIMEQIVDREADKKDNDEDDYIIREEYVILKDKGKGKGKGDSKIRGKIIIKRIINHGNKVYEQIVEKEGEGENEREKIISQKEDIVKGKPKKKKEALIEEYVILGKNGEIQKLDGSQKIIFIKFIIKGNKVIEYEIEREGIGRSAKDTIISQKEYNITDKLLQLLKLLGIEIQAFESSSTAGEKGEDDKNILRGKNKKEKNKIEDEKVITHGGSPKQGKKGGDKKEDEKEETGNEKRGDDGERKNVEKEIITGGSRNLVQYTEYRNELVQFPHKWRTHPRLYGKDSRYCRVCRNTHGLIRKYGLNMCRKCFRERFHLIGFRQTK